MAKTVLKRPYDGVLGLIAALCCWPPDLSCSRKRLPVGFRLSVGPQATFAVLLMTALAERRRCGGQDARPMGEAGPQAIFVAGGLPTDRKRKGACGADVLLYPILGDESRSYREAACVATSGNRKQNRRSGRLSPAGTRRTPRGSLDRCERSSCAVRKRGRTRRSSARGNRRGCAP